MRRVPPVGFGVDVRYRLTLVGSGAGRIGHHPKHLHIRLRPRVILSKWDHPRIVFYGLPVTEPVPDLKLQPACGQQVQCGRRREALARHQLAANHPGTRRHHCGHGLLPCHLERSIASKPRSRAAHKGTLQIIRSAIRGAPHFHVRVRRQRVFLRNIRHPGVVQILRPQRVADAHQFDQSTNCRQTAPTHLLVQSRAGRVEQISQREFDIRTPKNLQQYCRSSNSSADPCNGLQCLIAHRITSRDCGDWNSNRQKSALA